MSEPEPKLFESRSRSGNKKFRLHNTAFKGLSIDVDLAVICINRYRRSSLKDKARRFQLISPIPSSMRGPLNGVSIEMDLAESGNGINI